MYHPSRIPLDLDAFPIQYTASGMGSFAMLTENRATMISQARNSARARERERRKKKKLKILQTISAGQEMENQLETSHIRSMLRQALYDTFPKQSEKNNRKKYSS